MNGQDGVHNGCAMVGMKILMDWCVQKIGVGERERDMDKEKQGKERIAQQAKHVESFIKSKARTAEGKLGAV
eukprot:1150027-Pelagomonas_calceolata.AAC.6